MNNTGNRLRQYAQGQMAVSKRNVESTAELCQRQKIEVLGINFEDFLPGRGPILHQQTVSIPAYSWIKIRSMHTPPP